MLLYCLGRGSNLGGIFFLCGVFERLGLVEIGGREMERERGWRMRGGGFRGLCFWWFGVGVRDGIYPCAIYVKLTHNKHAHISDISTNTPPHPPQPPQNDTDQDAP